MFLYLCFTDVFRYLISFLCSYIFSESFVLASSQPKITDINLGIDASAIKCIRSWFSRLRKVLWSTENQICGDQVSSYFTSYSLLSHETMSHFALGSFNNGVTLLLTSVMTVVRYLAVMLYYRSIWNYAWMVSFHCAKKINAFLQESILPHRKCAV